MSEALKSKETRAFDVDRIREDFPILNRQIHGKPLVYLDNAASLQKPVPVLNRMDQFFRESYANVHRALHQLGQEATMAYEEVRTQIQMHLGASAREEIIFCKGATEALNLVASSWGEIQVQEGDEICVTRLEHHANFVPWLALAQKKKAHLRIVELNENFQISEEDLRSKLSDRTKIFAVSAGSNVLGTETDLSRLAGLAKKAGATVVVDATQAMAHARWHLLSEAPIDFLVFSSHKLGGPGGAGVLWGKKEHLEQMPPYQLGGEMISSVSDDSFSLNDLPYKFEAGTPAIGEVVGMGAAMAYMSELGLSAIREYEEALVAYALPKLLSVPGLRLLGSAERENRAPIFSFQIEGVHPQDLAQYLDSKGICIRTGLHCAEPLHRHFAFEGSARASLSFYNRFDEVDHLVEMLKTASRFFVS